MNVVRLCKSRLCWVVAILLMGGACSNPTKESVQAENAVMDAQKELMSSVSAKRLLGYWGNFNFKKNLQESDIDNVEQRLVDFISLFPSVADTVVQAAIHDMLKKASCEPKTLTYFMDQYSHYLYDPNSPMRNEGYYEHVLTYVAEYETLPLEKRVKYITQLKLVQKNQVGTVASNFEYLAEDGSYRHMYEGGEAYKMLVFYDPTCTHCAAIMRDLEQAPAVHNCIENGFLEILSISLHPDKESWAGYQERIPDNWTDGWDEKGTIIQEGLYNIRAYPTIFLLDKTNVVLLKDAPLDVTLRYLVSLVSRTS